MKRWGLALPLSMAVGATVCPAFANFLERRLADRVTFTRLTGLGLSDLTARFSSLASIMIAL